MFLAIPFIKASRADYPQLAQAILRKGTNPAHTLAVVSLRSEDEGAFLFSTSLTDYFGRIVKISIEDEPRSGAATANQFFRATVAAFGRYRPAAGEAPNTPMMYFDPSYRPNNPRWLDDLQAEYYQKGAPVVFGNFENGKPEGPLILGPAFASGSALLPFLPNETHWRDYLACELAQNSVKANGIGPHSSAVLSPVFDI